MGISWNGTTVAYYMAEVISHNDYYPFGMLQTGRQYSVGEGYRYGFNGKENDNEVKGTGNQQDYGFRIYDPRLGKFLSVDPLTKDYPWYTPYQFAGNKPINSIDVDGLEESDSKGFLDLIGDLFSTDKFGGGGSKVAEGVVQKTAAETGNASYQIPQVPLYVQRYLATRDKYSGSQKMISGTADMYVASAENAFNLVPAERAVSLTYKSLVRGSVFLQKIEARVLSVKTEVATKILTKDEQEAILQWISNQTCFVESTKISVKNGFVRIEEIKAGDSVLAFDEHTGQISLQRVYQTYTKTVGSVLYIVAGNTEIICTPEHPFWARGKWINADNLKLTDSLTLLDHSKVPISSIVKKDSVVTVYNFAVENLHTYFVSSASILVHNNCEKLREALWKTAKPGNGSKNVRYLAGRSALKTFEELANEAGVDSKNWKILKNDGLEMGFEFVKDGEKIIVRKSTAGNKKRIDTIEFQKSDGRGNYKKVKEIRFDQE